MGVGRVLRASAVLACVVLTACSGGGGSSSKTTSPASGPGVASYAVKGSAPTDLPVQGPRPPAEGALVGAWVQPQDFTQTGRVAAFTAFEKVVGRRLGIAQVFRKWDQPFGTESDQALATSDRLLMLSWAGADTRVIASGADDAVIRAKAREVLAFRKPILLRWRWEMDRPNLRASIWSPADYVAAWKHIREIFAQERVTNAGWVWCPHADGFLDPSRHAADFYPGDDQVDWLCADVYANDPATSFADVATPFLDWAAGHAKPIVIGEFGVQHGAKAAWLSNAFAFIQARPQIRAAVYFDGFGSGNGLDHRIESSPPALTAFHTASDIPYFTPALTCVLAGRRAGPGASTPQACQGPG